MPLPRRRNAGWGSCPTWSSTTWPTRARSPSRPRRSIGAPLLDLDSIQPDLDTVRIVSEKILRKHRVLPLVKRGKKLFIAISDPTNLHALDEVKFATGFSIEAVVVEEDKLNKLLAVFTRAGRHVDAGTRRRRFRDGRSRSHLGRRRGRCQGLRSLLRRS
ncbi:MAG: hypothetical protein V9E93_00645 [Steroidobacteraceae bacterium]